MGWNGLDRILLLAETWQVPKFVLIDQSLTKIGGHHFEYAARVIRSAQDMGYDPVVLAHRNFDTRVKLPCPLVPIYRFGFWERPGSRKTRKKPDAAAETFLRTVRWEYSPLGAAWLGAEDLDSFLFNRQFSPQSRWDFPRTLAFYRARKTHQQMLAWRQRRATAKQVTGGDNTNKAALGLSERLRGLFSRKVPDVTWHRGTWKKAKAFADDTWRGLKSFHLKRGDIVFIPTVNFTELRGVVECVKANPRLSEVSWHFVLRRDLFHGNPPDFRDQLYTVHPEKLAIMSALQVIPPDRLFLYTDTEPLTEQYNLLNAHAFQTLPIPIEPLYRTEVGEAGLEKGPPLNVVYAGDARAEKGYQHIPDLVKAVRKDLVDTGLVRFRLQSNINMSPPEPEIATARNALLQMAGTGIELYPTTLSEEDYKDLVTSTDIMLVLYDRPSYLARSSGIFTEALGAGIPVLTPAASWMAAEMGLLSAEYHADLQRRVPVVERRSAGQLTWGIFGGGVDLPAPAATINPVVRLSGNNTLYSRVRPPFGADHMLLRFHLEEGRFGDYVSLIADCLDINNAVIVSRSTVVGGLRGMEVTTLIRIEPGTSAIWIGLRGAYTTQQIPLHGLELVFLNCGGAVPLEAGGRTYHDVKEIPDLLRDLVFQHDAYRAQLEPISVRWTDRHSTVRLVEQLHANAALSMDDAARDAGVAEKAGVSS